ncbi:MAG: HAMP domain-containing histidine kinase, partial [Salinivirgaceae bacterium]|nr:HAMP domain-containing histidine kinase [Salinivirgaceae bacterium]
AVSNISLQVEHRGGTIKLVNNAKNDFARVDQSHFINVIYNLLDNANKYSIDTPPDITVTTRNIGTDLLISVSDKGIGMDKETQEKVFEKFYRHPTGNVHTVKGFGLGLSYVKAIVLSCKGEIKVSSQKGEGSTFEIWLPTIDENVES